MIVWGATDFVDFLVKILFHKVQITCLTSNVGLLCKYEAINLLRAHHAYGLLGQQALQNIIFVGRRAV